MNHYIENFKFYHIPPDTVAQLRSDIAWVTSDLEAHDAPLSDDRRQALENRLAGLHEAHVTLQIRDTYLQMFVRVNREKGSKVDCSNPLEILGFDFFHDKSNEQLLEDMAGRHEERREIKRAKRDTLVARRRLAKSSVIWHRPETLTDRYQAVNGRLHEVREQRRADGETVRETSPYPVNSSSIRFKGERISTAVVLRILTGQVPKRGPKPKGPRYRAQVRSGSRVVHLGMFDTEHERDAAVLNHRLGLGVNPAP